MDRELFSLARQGVLRKKRSSLLVFLVLLLSFTFAMVSLALVSSINATNRDFRYKIYGKWYCGLMTGTAEDGAWLQEPEQQKWVDSLGTARSVGRVITSAGPAAIGTLDDGMREVGCISLDDGRWPKKADEIAIEGPVLSSMGLDETLGQQITLSVQVPCGERSVTVEKTYTLCGVIHRYSTLWILTQNPTNQLLVSMAVTEDAVDALLAEAESAAGAKQTPVFQYFVGVEGEENQFYSSFWLAARLQETRGPNGERMPCVNGAAYPTYVKQQVYDSFYLNIIAAVALIAVLCVYIMQLPADIHSFAILRSIGITKAQMAQLVLCETLLLLVPAILLGIPLAAVGTWASMKLLVFSGSVPVTVVIPLGEMCKVILLWLAGIAAARLFMFFITVHMPLTGRFQLSHKKARLVRAGRSVLIVALLCILGSVTIFTQMNTDEPKRQKSNYEHRYHYDISHSVFTEGVVPESDIDQLRQMPGIVSTEAVSLSYVGLSYNDMPERKARIFIVDESDCWADVIKPGEDRDAFYRGDLVLLCFPDETSSFIEQYCYSLLPGEDPDSRDYPLPTGKLHLNFYGPNGTLQAQDDAAASVRYLPDTGEYYKRSNGLLFSNPYTIVCSGAYFEKILAQMTPNALWGSSYFEVEPGVHENSGNYVAGQEFGYQKVLMRVDTGVASGGTDALISAYCKENDLLLYNVRQEMTAALQEADQELILLYSSGGCILIVALVLLLSALTLEAEQEKRSYGILRAIGMSRRQMRRRVLRRAFGSSLLAAVGGWAIYLIYALRVRMDWVVTPIPGTREALPITWENTVDYVLYRTFHEWQVPAILTALCLLVPLAAYLLAKRRLLKGDMER